MNIKEKLWAEYMMTKSVQDYIKYMHRMNDKYKSLVEFKKHN